MLSGGPFLGVISGIGMIMSVTKLPQNWGKDNTGMLSRLEAPLKRKLMTLFLI